MQLKSSDSGCRDIGKYVIILTTAKQNAKC